MSNTKEIQELRGKIATASAKIAYNKSLFGSFCPKAYMKYLYFIQGGDAVKIGVSVDPESRLDTLETGNPFNLRLIAKFPNKGHLENKVHKQLSHLRINREWFRCTKEVISLIKTLQEN